MLTVAGGATIEEFDIVIEKIQRQSKPDTKGLVIRGLTHGSSLAQGDSSG